MEYVQAFIVFVCGEIAGLILFPIATHYLGPQNASAWDIKAILKGIHPERNPRTISPFHRVAA